MCIRDSLNTGNPDKGVCALPYVRQSDNQTIYIPVNIIGNLYVSNGMSAGNTASEARVQAFSEIFERYAKNKIISEGIAMPDIPLEVLERYPLVLEAVAKLREQGFPVLLKDASLGGGFPVINVTLINPEDGGVFPSFGAHPQFGVALERTLTELLQGRSLDQLNVFERPSLDLEEVASTRNLEEHFTDSNGLVHWNFFAEKPDYEFSDWNFSGETEEEFQHLLKIFHEMEKEVYIADHQHLGVYACRVHVPGMSEIYPFDELKWNNNNEGTHLRQILLNLHEASKEDLREVYEELVEQGYSDDKVISEFVGVVGDKDSLWSELRMGELKVRLALALGMKNEAAEHIRFVTSFVRHSGELEKTFRCLEDLLTMQEDSVRPTPYLVSLELMYGESIVKRAFAMLTGDDAFFGLPQANDKLEGFKMHTALMATYQKLQNAKASYFNK